VVRFTPGPVYRIDVKEPSGLAFLSTELGFITVDDDTRAIIRLTLPREGDHGGQGGGEAGVEEIDVGEHRHLLQGLEGVAYDAEAHTLLVVSENRRVLSELTLVAGRDGLRLGDPVKRRTLEKIGQEKSHGWEGITLLAAHFTPDRRERVLAVQERDPRGVAVLDRATLQMETFLSLPKEIAREADDLSDLTIDPATGHLFLLSDESAAVIETVFEGTAASGGGASARVTWTLRADGRTELPNPDPPRHRLQPEGLVFDAGGDLWVVSEGDRSLRCLRREDGSFFDRTD
jgi:uncharacterized protein YjiK